jgi:predicted DNA-binding protein with PD1-like motif
MALNCHALRLKPGQEILSEIVTAVQSVGFKAAFIMTCVGSCTSATIRLASATAAEPNQVVSFTAETSDLL